MGYIKEILQRGQIPAILPAQWRAVDGTEEVRFNTAGHRSLWEAWENQKLGCGELRALSAAVREVLWQCREHLLPMEGVALAPEHIYVSEAGRFAFLYHYRPAQGTGGGAIPLAEFLLPRLDRSDRAAVLAGYDLYQRAEEGLGVLEAFRQLESACASGAPLRTGEMPAEARRQDGSVPVHTAPPEDSPAPPLPEEEERQRLLDAFFSGNDDEPEERRVRVFLRPKLWQQRILIGAGMVIAAAVVVGMAAGDMMIGAGCTLIAGAVGALAWLRRARG